MTKTKTILSDNYAVRAHRFTIRRITRGAVDSNMDATEAYDAAMEALDAAGYEPECAAFDALDQVIAQVLSSVLLEPKETKNETRPHPTATPDGCRKHARRCVAEVLADERRPLGYQGGPEHRTAMMAEARRLSKLAAEIEAWEAAR